MSSVFPQSMKLYSSGSFTVSYDSDTPRLFHSGSDGYNFHRNELGPVSDNLGKMHRQEIQLDGSFLLVSKTKSALFLVLEGFIQGQDK